MNLRFVMYSQTAYYMQQFYQNLNNKLTAPMHRSMNSTEVLSKTYSRVKIAESSIRQGSPISRPFSSRSKNSGDSLLHETLIAKNKKLSMMIRTVHTYMTNIEEMDWIMNQTEKIMKSYLKNTIDKGGVSHKIQIENLYNQMLKLISRFTGVDKKWIHQMTVPLKESKKFKNSENYNMMNFKKTQTIGSFKCTDTQNQEDGLHMHTDFSKIKLPSVIKENQIEENIQSSRFRFQQQTKIKQFEAAIDVLKQEIENQKKAKADMKRSLEQKILGQNKKIQQCHSEWEAYKTFAGGCIRKCKYYLNQFKSEGADSGKVQGLLDELFSLQSKLDRKILESSIEGIQIEKQQKVMELLDIEGQLKNKKDELDRVQTQRAKLNGNSKNSMTGDSELMKLLYVQATTIQHLI